MQHLPSAVFFITVVLIQITSLHAQNSLGEAETEIRKLEADQVNYLLSGNLDEMKKNWAENFTVNNPFNVVQEASMGPIQTGVLIYSKFERNTEKILIHDSVVIVMGMN